MSSSDVTFDLKQQALTVVNSTGSSTEFSQGAAGAAVCNQQCIQYAIPDADRSLNILTASVTSYQASGSFSALNTWTMSSIAAMFPASLRANATVKYFLSAVSVGDYNYFFWLDTNNVYRALRTRPDLKEPSAVTTVDLRCLDAVSQTPTSNLAVFALPSSLPQLTGKIGAVILCTEDTKFALQPLVFDPADFVAGTPWTPVGPLGNSIVIAFTTDKGFTSLTDLSAGWVDQGTLQTSPRGALSPHVSLIIVAHRESGTTLSYGMDMVATFDAVYRGRRGLTTMDMVCSVELPSSMAPPLGATISPGPDGTLYLNYSNSSDSSCYRYATLILNSASNGQAGYGAPGLHSPTWSPAAKDLDGTSPSIVTTNTPCAVFIPLPATRGPSPVPVNAPGGGAPTTYQDCTLQKWIKCIFTASSEHVPQLSTFLWGTMFGIPNYITTPVTSDYANQLLLTMVADTMPYPIPAPEIWGPDSPSGMVNWLLCTYEYAVAKDEGTSVESTISAGGGFKFDTTLILGGAGIKATADLSSGYTSIASQSDFTHVAQSSSVTTKGIPGTMAGQTGDVAQLSITQEGALFGSYPPGEIGVDLYAVQERGQSTIKGQTLTLMHPILLDPPTPIAADFRAYCYMPGDLRTYQEKSINDRMAYLFHRLADKSQFVINGEDFSNFYTEGNYLQKIVERFGTNSFGPDKNLSYLEFSFSETAINRNEFQATTTFTDTGGAYVNGSGYAGLAWDSEESIAAGVLGIVEVDALAVDWEGSFMIGAEFKGEWDTTTSTSVQWGLKLGEYLNPLARGEAYSVRMYFLKAHPLWAREVQNFGYPDQDPAKPETLPPTVDFVNSAPIRLLFTVSYVSPTLAARLDAITWPAWPVKSSGE